MKLNKIEIEQRISKLYKALQVSGQDWTSALIFGKVSQYYFTGTMQDGVFVLRKDGSYAYFARRSYSRAKLEALIDNVLPMGSYKDMYDFIGRGKHRIFLDKNVANVLALDRLNKAFQIEDFFGIDSIISHVRAVKSEYELQLLRESGRRHQILLNEVVPSLLKEGITEYEFTAQVFREMMQLGYQGLSRFSMFQAEMFIGQIGFGDNAVYPTSFDGPGGMKGLSPVMPAVGDDSRKLKKGELIFADIGFGCGGYHSDRTQVYYLGSDLPDYLAAAHNICLNLERKAASMLKPGAIPSEIYKETVEKLDHDFRVNFMGVGEDAVKFLGHGMGLHVDEWPVIAPGFNEPLQENMVLAIEPKKSFPGVGIVGVEDSYIVSKNGGECITGGERDIMMIC